MSRKFNQRVNKSNAGSKARMRYYSFREAEKVVLRNGFTLVRKSGDHFYYKKEGEPKLLNLSRNLNYMIWYRIVSEFSLDINA